MDRMPFPGRHSDRQTASPANHFGQPPVQIPFSDPFQNNRDPFLPGGSRRGSLTPSSRVWPSPQGNGQLHHHQPSPSMPPVTQAQALPPPPPNGVVMTSPYDASRRRSLGASSSPSNYIGAPFERHAPPPSFPARNMPPPSPPQNPPSSSLHLGSAPRGPPTTSPFAGIRDLASHRQEMPMSISAILGAGEEQKPHTSPLNNVAAPSSTPRSMAPPSPGRARSSSMRESGDRFMQRPSHQRAGMFAETARMAPEPRGEGMFGSPQFRRDPDHSFRAFQPALQEHSHQMNGNTPLVRPISQPVDMGGQRVAEELLRSEGPNEARAGAFRNFGEPSRNDPVHLQDRPPFQNGITSHPQERAARSTPPPDRDGRSQGIMRFQSGTFGPAVREEPLSSFRSAFPPTSHPIPENTRESIEARTQDARRQISHPSPPPGDPAYDRGRNGFSDRPMTLEEHQRMEFMAREQPRKESDSAAHRAILNISPEVSRKGRNSPLPQAVQGAQPRHIGPGGDNPGIKMEFGRMFSGLGSGVGSTPHPGHTINGTVTPSRMSPSTRHMESGDLVRSAVLELDDRKGGPKTTARRNGRRSRDDGELGDGDGRNTPSGGKRPKTTHPTHYHHHHVHPPHHHHHHHHRLEPTESTPGSQNMLRFPSNPLSQANLAANQAHHHHHHHGHTNHHHHHPPRPVPPRKISTTVVSKTVLEACASKPRRHLGSQLYTTELSLPPATETPLGAKIKFSSKMKPIPVFQGKENCTFTVRVPRYYLAPSTSGLLENYNLEEICKRRQVWGSEIYTDDSDVVAAAVHSGWLKGDFGEFNDNLRDMCDNSSEQEEEEEEAEEEEMPTSMSARPRKPVKVPEGQDAHITVLILPPLESYASTNQHHIWSRDWKKPHDGMSFTIHGIDFVSEGTSSRFTERSASARKKRIAIEEANRREAAAGLLMFATGSSAVRVGA